MIRRIAPFIENFAESGLACLFTMVQGNIFAVGLGHWIVASQTGLFAGGIAALAILVAKNANRLVVAGILTVATAVVDYLVHPGNFGPVIMEAVVTGLAAGTLSLLAARLLARRRRRAATG